MFKLESYIAPILLSYVDKYIKNFKLEDSQVSLWGGEASFQNLDLRLEVLEQELQSPFSFISGHIRELLIHVPWTKLTSEPITITINTIECVLKLKEAGSSVPPESPVRDRGKKSIKQEVETPPNYVQSLINKIVSNIRIFCNNLILKYVEEDIVLSMNVKHLKLESCNEKWEAAYTDISPGQVVMRKLIGVNDLTICLDKRSASGKIEVYQEPMLYRCSMTMHMLRTYRSATANKTSLTRLDVYCNNMEFSVTEQQVPMFIRLLLLLQALHKRELKPEADAQDNGTPLPENRENDENSSTWVGWAWSYLAAVIPTQDDEDSEGNFLNQSGHIIQMGFYVDNASLTFKVSESSSEKGYYNQKKIRYIPIITLQLQGIYSEMTSIGIKWVNMSFGISEVKLLPVGPCSCSHPENYENRTLAAYIKIGSASTNHKTDSLFDADALENNGQYRNYDTNWDFNLTTNTESVLLERTPAVGFNYLYSLEIPEDTTSEVLSDLGSNYEFSNFPERAHLRLCVGPLKFRICPGLFHRIDTVKVAASFYDYIPYFTPKSEPSLHELLPASEEDFDALNEFIPTRTVIISLFEPVIELQLMDHPSFEPTKGNLLKKPKKHSSNTAAAPQSIAQIEKLPKMTLECRFVEITVVNPMYMNRLVHTTCQLPEPPPKMFDACFSQLDVRVIGLCSKLILKPAQHTMIVVPFNLSFDNKTILKPQYWIHPDISHNKMTFELENLILNGTKAKLMIVNHLIQGMFTRNLDDFKDVISTTLIFDAAKDHGMPYLELSIESVKFRKVVTNSTVCQDVAVGSVKAFIFESSDDQGHSDIQQVLFLSGPEAKQNDMSSYTEDLPLLTVTFQYPLKPEVQAHPPLLMFNLQEIKICIDPLLCKWLLYNPVQISESHQSGSSRLQDETFLTTSATTAVSKSSLYITSDNNMGSSNVTTDSSSKRISTHVIESVHGSSEREMVLIHGGQPFLRQIPEEETVDIQERIYCFLKTWYMVWKGMIFSGHISQCTIFLPTSSVSALGSRGVEDAIREATTTGTLSEVIVITLPFTNIQSAQKQNVFQLRKHLPVKLSDKVWTIDKPSFPWTISISDLNCYTIQEGQKYVFLKPVSLSATVGLSTKSTAVVPSESVAPDVKVNTQNPTSDVKDTSSGDKNIGYLGVYVHIDMTPVIISTFESQMYLFASILYGLTEAVNNLIPEKSVDHGKSPKVLPPPPQTAQSPSISPVARDQPHTLEETASDNTTLPPPASSDVTKSDLDCTGGGNFKLTAWIQWTITRLSVELSSQDFSQTEPRYQSTKMSTKDSGGAEGRQNSDELKLVIDIEDIVNSLDYQSVYLKLKSKIGAISVQHFRRSTAGGKDSKKWQPGPFSGVIARLREDVPIEKRHEDSGFVSVTVTRASSQHTHNLWGALQQQQKKKATAMKEEKRNTATQQSQAQQQQQQVSTSRYLTEVVINIQPIDLVLPPKTLMNFYQILVPLIEATSGGPAGRRSSPDAKTPRRTPTTATAPCASSSLNSQDLPLAYLECQDIRVIVPSSELARTGFHHDVCIVQVNKIALSPTVVNPVCRRPVRPDIYRQAAQARILNVPGSELEDRQYQLDIIGLSVSTATWEDLDHVLDMGNLEKRISENPAVEWNNLKQGQSSIIPFLSIKQVAEKFDVSIVAAPTMIYKNDIVVCGSSFEINFVSDIVLQLSLDQIKLASALINEFSYPFAVLEETTTNANIQAGGLKRTSLVFPYPQFDKYRNFNDDIETELTEFYRDSGIDTSEIRSVFSAKSQPVPLQSHPITPETLVKNQKKSSVDSTPRPVNVVPQSAHYYCEIPTEVLLTAGKISLSLYQVSVVQRSQTKGKRKKKNKREPEEDRNYEASEEESIDIEAGKTRPKYTPLIFIQLSQPNAYISKQYLTYKAQISCFDLAIKLCQEPSKYLSNLPTSEDFDVNLVETRSGSPDPVTGIPPAFCTLKYVKEFTKPASVFLELSRPTKIVFSTNKLLYLMTLKERILENFISIAVAVIVPVIDESKTGYKKLRDNLKGIDSVQIKTDQLVFVMETDQGIQACLNLGKLQDRLALCDRPEKVKNSTTMDCVTFTITKNKITKSYLNPWSFTVDITAFLDSWQSPNEDPQIHVNIDSDCLMFDVSPEQLKCLESVTREISEILLTFSSRKLEKELLERHDSQTRPNKENETKHSHHHAVAVQSPSLSQPKHQEVVDQHYKDDLRAGAFQFINANTNSSDELPLPYQVMFWNNKELSAMAWRYPQPRALTKVRVFPVPFEISPDLNSADQKICCLLQYYSEHHSRYLDYVQFQLSESDVSYLNLPRQKPLRAVACTWRVLLFSETPLPHGHHQQQLSVSPRALAACLRIDSYFNKNLVANVTMTVYLSKIDISLRNNFDKTAVVLPDSLSGYFFDLAAPDGHAFFTLSCENIRGHVASWNLKQLAIDGHFVTRCSVLDYTYLTEKALLSQFTSKFEVNVAKDLRCSWISTPIQMTLSPSVAHTLTLNAQMWAQNHNANLTGEQKRHFIVFTKYVVCNDTDVSLRFGQNDTDEDILLASRCFHLYCWRSHRAKRKLKIALEDKGWIWSKPFRVDFEGTYIISLSPENGTSLIVTVKSLSPTQKQITMSGQFVMTNMLLEHFEFKIVPDSKNSATDKDRLLRESPTHVIRGKSTVSSMFLDHKTKYFMRLRFFGLESAWTGDIPLKEHTKGAQPWLVKVPLQERGQFLSIWCRIVVQDLQKCKRILAMLWPLFTVKSNLPVTSSVHIETPILNVHLDTSMRGKGEIQQLYCPGTIDHSHRLILKTNDDTSVSHRYIPLSYSLVDQQQFFKKSEKEDIDEILGKLKQYSTTKWPYFDEELEGINWVVDDNDQPQTTIQVRYRNACEHSSSLLVEVVPWCLLANTFGCAISLMANGTELCRVSQYGIVAPPKLDENFHLGIDTGSGWYYSGPLQLAKSNWSQTFYMPTISGTLPIEGGIKTAVKCGSYVCMVYLSCRLVDEIRLLRVASTHVLSNYLVTQIQVVCFALPEGTSQVYEIPSNLSSMSFSVAPHSEKSYSGTSILRWYALDENCDSNTEYVLYLSVSLQQGLNWSCPIRVDRTVTRKSISVDSDKGSLPLVLISHEHKGQTFLSLYHDDRPQILIDNKLSVPLCCAQATATNENNAAQRETEHFDWFSRIDGLSRSFYTMPFVSEKFPELPQTCFSEKIVFAYASGDLEWSNAISITSDSDQFIRIPSYGDVKLGTKLTAYATLLTIAPVSQVEVSAIDIRGRLSTYQLLKSASSVLSSDKSDITVYLSAKSDQSVMSQATAVAPPPSQSAMAVCYDSVFSPTVPTTKPYRCAEALVFIQSFSVVFSTDQATEVEDLEVASFTFDGVGLEACQRNKSLTLKLGIADMQFDNLLYSRESFDFPVVFVGQDTRKRKFDNVLNVPVNELIVNNSEDRNLVFVEVGLETWKETFRNVSLTGVKDLTMTVNPLSCYIEDLYITRLSDYFKTLLPSSKSASDSPTGSSAGANFNFIPSYGATALVKVPEEVCWQSHLLARPLNVKNITVEPLSLLLSVHCSLKMYIALDQSPLQFGRFMRRRILTTAYRLGHAMTMHYLSGAIFGAGWVVSSLELLGSPGGLARAMGSGLRDFVNMPYRGLIQGPWAFLIGVTHGSASLMKHLTAGTLQSITKLASSLARNLDRLTMDEEHLRRTEEQRRRKPQGVTQGFMQGLTGLGISLLGAVGGIAHHPLQSIMSDTASPRSLVAGVGLGLVGVITKPLSGAAELVALTGQGLLQGAGWNPLPQPRFAALPAGAAAAPSHGGCPNSALKYEWKLLSQLSCKSLLYVTEATGLNNATYTPVALILTDDALVIVNIEDDALHRILSLTQVHVSTDRDDPTLISCKVSTPAVPTTAVQPTTSGVATNNNNRNTEEDIINNDLNVEMDPACRARVADYVRATATLLQIRESREQDDALSSHNVTLNSLLMTEIGNAEESSEVLYFYLNPLNRNYFVCMLGMAKQQNHCSYKFATL